MSDLSLSLQSSALTSLFSLPDEDDGAGRPHEQQRQQETRLLDVTVTVISLSGVRARETSKKSYRSKLESKFAGRGPLSRSLQFRREPHHEDEASAFSSLASMNSNEVERSSTHPAATFLVASFDGGAEDRTTWMTHVPSLPIPLPPPCSMVKGIGASAAARTFDGVVDWPESGGATHSKLSSFSFQRRFPLEAGAGGGRTTRKIVPQLCPIQVSVSRTNNGKMYRLGSAHLFVSGTEREEGGVTMNVPVVNFETAFKVVNGGKDGASMMRLKGDTLKCGLAARAMLRVIVRVSEPTAVASTEVGSAIASPRTVPTGRTKNDAPREAETPGAAAVAEGKEGGTGKDGGDVVRPSDPASVCTDAKSEASWDYDADQQGVILKWKKPVATPRGSPHPDNEEGSRPCATSASPKLTYSATNDEDEDDDDDWSLLSESSKELLKIIANASGEQRRRRDEAGPAPARVPREGRDAPPTKAAPNDRRRRPWDDDGENNGSCGGFVTPCSRGNDDASSIATPPTSPRMLMSSSSSGEGMRTYIFPSPDDRGSRPRGRAATATAAAIRGLSRRLTCCAAVGRGVTMTARDLDILASVDEGSFETSSASMGDMYSLKGREHSLETVDSDQSPSW